MAAATLWMIKEVCFGCGVLLPLWVCQSGLKVTVCRTNEGVLESMTEKVWVSRVSRLFSAPSLTHNKSSPRLTRRHEYFWSIVRFFYFYFFKGSPHVKLGMGGKGAFCCGCAPGASKEGVGFTTGWVWCYFSQRKDICFSIPHICVNFPHANTSRNGDLNFFFNAFVFLFFFFFLLTLLMVGVWVREVPDGDVGTFEGVDRFQETLHVHFLWPVAFGSPYLRGEMSSGSRTWSLRKEETRFL